MPFSNVLDGKGEGDMQHNTGPDAKKKRIGGGLEQ
jgi:hypothetical protein